MPILDLFVNSVRTRDKAVAVEEADAPTTYGELEAWSDGAAALLEQAGVRPGDRILLMLDNGAAYVAMLLACWKADAVAVPLHPEHTGACLDKILADCGPVALAAPASRIVSLFRSTDAAYVPRILVTDATVEQIPSGLGLRVLSAPLCRECAQAGLRPQDDAGASDDDLAMILYTSGTTAQPKGVMLSHGNLTANARSILEYLPIRPSDRTISLLAFSYAYGNSVLMSHLAAGATLVIDHRARYPQGLVEALLRRSITAFPAVPSHFAMLLSRPGLLARPMPALRYMTSAGFWLPPATIHRLRRALPHVELHVMYGQTEATARLASLPPARLGDKVGSVGRAIPGVEVRIVRADGSAAGPNEVGEIVARGKSIMLGYWNDPAETSSVLQDGWLHTGDLATMDEEGFIWIRDRGRDLIKKGAVRVSPHEIEEVLLRMQEIAECAVVGVPDPVLGEEIEAFIVPSRGASEVHEKEILRRLACEIPRYKLPRRVHAVSVLPRTISGKVRKSLLRAQGSGFVPAGT
ncbi:MAG: acyl--CoA ligase [Planctomycetes bacterium]|nr:acyl--CoA ligase [Planctomycetota bacterium]